jgi:hypothetical protein
MVCLFNDPQKTTQPKVEKEGDGEDKKGEDNMKNGDYDLNNVRNCAVLNNFLLEDNELFRDNKKVQSLKNLVVNNEKNSFNMNVFLHFKISKGVRYEHIQMQF